MDSAALPEDANTFPNKAQSMNGAASETTKTSNPNPPLAPASAKNDDDVMTKIFTFLSTATPTTLGGVAAGLAAATYLVLGQVGLVVIGAFSGITLFVAWEAKHPEVSRAVRGEKGTDFLNRLFETRSQLSKTRSDQNDETDFQSLVRSFDDFEPETREALNDLVEAVVRDYIEYWYSPIVPSDNSFPLSVRKVLTSFVLSVSNQLSRKRPADAFVDFLTHTCSIIIVFFSEMTSAYASVSADNKTSAADAMYSYLASNTESPLANLLNTHQQAGKLKMVAEDLLSFLDRPTYDCDPARIFLREILANIVLEGTLQTCSKPEWINGWIVYLLESGDTDLSHAIDEAMQDQKAFSDIDGNFGSISLSKGNRNSYEMDRQRRKEQVHQKKLSKADEEMERAMDEMKRLNEMIAQADKARDSTSSERERESETAGRLKDAIKENAKELDLDIDQEVIDSAKKAVQQPLPDQGRSLKEPATEKLPSRENVPQSPTTPGTADVSPQSLSPAQKREVEHRRFTSFDQIVPPGREEPEEEDGSRGPPPPLTLVNAIITIHDEPGTTKLRNKPTWEYLVQIEPAAVQHPGWMTMKSYAQFEVLHESIRRLATISGATAFLEAHATFPSWKIHTRSSLRGDIERYMRAACAEKALAESESMKKFLEKDQEVRQAINRGFSFESMGKGMLGVIQNAPKGALDGGKGLVGGVTGVLGNIGIGQRKSPNPAQAAREPPPAVKTTGINSPRPLSLSALPKSETVSPMRSRDSLDSQRSSVIATQPGKMPPMDRRPSAVVDTEQEGLQPSRADRWERKSLSTASSAVHSRASSMAAMRSPSEISLSNMRLPPPPHEMADDYDSPTETRQSSDTQSRLNDAPLSPFTALSSPTRSFNSQQPEKHSQPSISSVKRTRKQFSPLSEQETRVAVELLFAVINELYTLSSAWNIRRTLLTAAKSFLVRPGNPSLVSIQQLIQDNVLDTNTTDSGIAAHLKKIRENSLPTEEERKAWPAELTDEEKEELRVKARKLFIQSSVPAALMGIMGQSATSEALGRLFDCLQIEEVSRGLFFGIILQAVRVITH
ncbi:5-oxoprolinase [Apiospora kogelbergensis]|uniref:5-oxoprolinase n=2 Tax=Apiospora kogelbergensis TaxID=1337665 RepID=A0AAW0QQV4_9PEZI